MSDVMAQYLSDRWRARPHRHPLHHWNGCMKFDSQGSTRKFRPFQERRGAGYKPSQRPQTSLEPWRLDLWSSKPRKSHSPEARGDSTIGGSYGSSNDKNMKITDLSLLKSLSRAVLSAQQFRCSIPQIWIRSAPLPDAQIGRFGIGIGIADFMCSSLSVVMMTSP